LEAVRLSTLPFAPVPRIASPILLSGSAHPCGRISQC